MPILHSFPSKKDLNQIYPVKSLLLFANVFAEISDIIDEAIILFRPNSYFKNFEIKGPADRTLVYLLLATSECLSKLNGGMNKGEAKRTLSGGMDIFPLPGEAGFPLNALFVAPSSRREAGRVTCLVGIVRNL